MHQHIITQDGKGREHLTIDEMQKRVNADRRLVHQEIQSDYNGGHGAFPDERESSFFQNLSDASYRRNCQQRLNRRLTSR